jgi:hypothetical protein
MRDLALEHAAAQLDDAEYLARMARLRGELEILGGNRPGTCQRVARPNGSTPSPKHGSRRN